MTFYKRSFFSLLLSEPVVSVVSMLYGSPLCTESMFSNLEAVSGYDTHFCDLIFSLHVQGFPWMLNKKTLKVYMFLSRKLGLWLETWSMCMGIWALIFVEGWPIQDLLQGNSDLCLVFSPWYWLLFLHEAEKNLFQKSVSVCLAVTPPIFMWSQIPRMSLWFPDWA